MSKLKEAILGFSFFLIIIFGIGMSVIAEHIGFRVIGFFLLIGAVVLIVRFKDEQLSTLERSGGNYKNDDESNLPKSDNDDSNIGYVNPASGALMVDGMNSTDTFGNGYGSDISGSFCDEIGGVER